MSFGDGLANGIGNAVSEIDRMCTNIMLLLIVIAFILMIIAFRNKNYGFKITARIAFILFSLITIFCFQHEVRLYKTGGTLLGISIIGFIATLLPKNQ